MAKDLYDDFTQVREAYQRANDILGFDLARYSFEGPEETLKQTQVTQPAIFVHCAALLGLLSNQGLQPAMAAGHSLGEYTAFYAAGVFTFEDALRLVKVRAEQMQKAGELNAGAMAAIIGLEAAAVKAVCQEAETAGIVQIANYNSPAQLVISGSETGVEKAMEIARDRGARKVIPLVVSGAFHSPLMEYACPGLRQAIEETEFTQARFPVYTNVLARPVTQPDEIKKLMLQQLTNPVHWVSSIENMIADGATDFYEIGPGKVLTGLLKRINRTVPGTSISGSDDLGTI